jgi:hypothetical protein
MKKALKVFSIISLVIVGMAFLGNANDPSAFGYTFIMAMVLVPQSILGILISNKKE